MKPIDDNELILFHYRDGLEESRLAEIGSALSSSTELRARYTCLCRMLDEVDVPAPDADAGFEQRLWAGLELRMAQSKSRTGYETWLDRSRHWLARVLAPRLLIAGGVAAAVVIALVLGFMAGRSGAPDRLAVQPEVRPTMANRVLDDFVAGHLRATEGLLLTAVNDEGGEWLGGNREMAKSMVESNRLYAAAAARSGNFRLADFLRQLEPVLLEVANQPASSNVEDMQGLREYLRTTDLLFQVRATESRIEAAARRSL